MTPKQSEIYMINFGPGQGHEYRLPRPAIILMADKILAGAKIITCVPLTSKSDNFIADDIKLAKDPENRLVSDSIIKMHHISACDRSRMMKYIGRLADSDWKKVAEGLKRIFGI